MTQIPPEFLRMKQNYTFNESTMLKVTFALFEFVYNSGFCQSECKAWLINLFIYVK